MEGAPDDRRAASMALLGRSGGALRPRRADPGTV
jgi:hypothetical protein